MSARLSRRVQLLVRLFALALRLYPEEVRREYVAEMQAVFRLKAGQAAQQSAWRLFTLACGEARDLPLAIFLAHVHAEGGRMRSSFPNTSDQTPWPAALLSLLPFFIAGPLRIILSYQPGWSPRESSLLYSACLLFCSLAVFSGLALGAAKKFPRWAYPYVFYMAFSLHFLTQYTFNLLGWKNVQNSFFLSLAAFLLVLWLPGLRWFYRNISQDWTLLSYGLYGFVLFLLAGLDYDETPRLTLWVLLPSLLPLGVALAHLRIRLASLRIAALLAGTFAGLFAWLAPIFGGMISIWAGILIGLSMLLWYGAILTLILLAPLLVTRAIHAWRAKRT